MRSFHSEQTMRQEDLTLQTWTVGRVCEWKALLGCHGPNRPVHNRRMRSATQGQVDLPLGALPTKMDIVLERIVQRTKHCCA